MEPSKKELRKACWLALRVAGAARFPGVEGRIPNFVGAEAAAKHLIGWSRWKRAKVIKSNPDSPQRPARHAALKEGKKLYLAVPRLADGKPFVEIDPADFEPDEFWPASSIKGGLELGHPVSLEEMEPIDLIVTGCVGATREGARLGKGGGYSDIEYALLREVGLVGARTPVVTLVHPAQILADGAIPMTRHDLSLDRIATPEGLIECPRVFKRAKGILWDELDAAKIDSIPVLAARAPA
jgi:5-formyltetrahydrofolate cyclo-ligase